RTDRTEKFKKTIANDVIVSFYYIHFDYILSCITINGKILPLEGYFVTREVNNFFSYNITRFIDSSLQTLVIKTALEIIRSGYRVRCVKSPFMIITRKPIKDY